jgi:hypothetical protein
MSTIDPVFPVAAREPRDARVRSLTLVFEQKLFELLPSTDANTRLEASGIDIDGTHFLIVFDNLTRIARIPFRREPFEVRPGTFIGDDPFGVDGFEDLALDIEGRRLLLLREAVAQHDGTFRAEIAEWNDRFTLQRSRTLPFEFEDVNKGFEGLALIRRGGRQWLLALCEGNRCHGGKKGREPGGGRIHVFGDEGGAWVLERELRLPEDVLFEDYSGLAIDGDRVGVVSQTTSMLWVSHLAPDGWVWEGPSAFYEFPRTRSGELLYSEIEGLAWLGPERIAVVSNRSKREQTSDEATKDQSIHVFDLD